jgi:hypothetical protein
MHVLLGKFLELLRMKQDPLRVVPKAHFPHRWRGPRILSAALPVQANTAADFAPHD